MASETLLKHDLGYDRPLIGVDEVGRGALAGPLYAAAIHCSSLAITQNQWLKEVYDSKKLNFPKRAELAELLQKNFPFAVAQASVKEIDCLGLSQANQLAMRRAVEKLIKILPPQSYLVLVDGIVPIKKLFQPQELLKKGDQLSFHIAAASIIAKVERDRVLARLHAKDPRYNWGQNKGYGTADHSRRIHEYGPSIHHRPLFLRKLNLKTEKAHV